MLVKTQSFTFAEAPELFRLECGRSLSPVTLAYETYGELNEEGDNAILIAHGFTGDAHAAGVSEESGRLGWWDLMIGPGKAFDTTRYFVVSSNVLGGCAGSTGPSSFNPSTGKPYGSAFPPVTTGDMVESQRILLKSLGVTSLASVSGSSMGGQQALQWMVTYPEFVRSAIPIACSARLSALALALCEVSRSAVTSDPEWRGGHYYGGSNPGRGLALARMAAHLTYVSEEHLEEEFGRALDPGCCDTMRGEFRVQSYLRAEGENFVKRFDANSFLYLSQAIEHFDLSKNAGSLAAAFTHVRSRVLLLSFTTDWLFPPTQLQELEMALREAGADVRHVTIDTSLGHDAFLTDTKDITPLISEFLARDLNGR